MSSLFGAVSLGCVAAGAALFWLSQQEPYTRSDGALAVVGFLVLLVGSMGFGWVVA